jgi:poly-gamma-glutamate capsule biosynthesis protein CapA/YwtB (metallophosphatase superfamily)
MQAPERVAIVASISVVALIALALAGTYIYRQSAQAKSHTIYISSEAEGECRPIVDAYMKAYPDPAITYASKADAGLVLAADKAGGRGAIEVHPIPALDLVAGTRKVPLRPSKTYWLSCDASDRTVSRLAKFLDTYHEKQEPVTITAMGDIIPGRTVAKMMALKGVGYPFSKMAPIVKGADIVYADLEAPLSDRVKPPHKGMAFIAPSSTVEGLKMLGINVVSLANNHSTNFGLNTFTDTLTLLKNSGIAYAGGGANLTEARAPAVVEAGGTSFAFLDYNAVIGSLNATPTRAGVSWIRMKPWAKDSADDMALVRAAVQQAKSQGHFVVACFHWSEEYKHQPSVSERNMAHLACDAGADLVIGSHPHCIQSIEIYNGKLIAYSLGNFIFDQMQHDYTREGVVMKCRYNGSVLTGLEFIPYVIQDWCQPVVAAGSSGQKILSELLSISGIK